MTRRVQAVATGLVLSGVVLLGACGDDSSGKKAPDVTDTVFTMPPVSTPSSTTTTTVATTTTVDPNAPTTTTTRDPSTIEVGQTYTIQKNDTIPKIAKKFGVNPDDIIALNAIKDPNKIFWGTKIKIPKASSSPTTTPSTTASDAKPSGKTYTVQAGDGWYKIAKRLGVKLADLLAVNDATVETTITPGQKLQVPI